MSWVDGKHWWNMPHYRCDGCGAETANWPGTKNDWVSLARWGPRSQVRHWCPTCAAPIVTALREMGAL